MTREKARDLFETVESIKNTLVAVATGGDRSDNSGYGPLRAIVLDDPLVRDRVPAFVRTCRSLAEFWSFIQPKFLSYRERREYLREQFEPALSFLEGASNLPADAVVSAGLKASAADQVHAMWAKALDRRTDDPEGAITAARTLLETTCKHLLEAQDETPDEKADLPKLYGTLAAKLSLAPSQHTEQVFKQILGGCHAVVEGLGALRNRLSDAHGRGKAGARPSARHAQLAVNLAGSLALFFVETTQEQAKKASAASGQE